MLATAVAVVGILVCCICDVAVRGNFSWSQIVACAVLLAWGVSFPVMIGGRKGVLASAVVMSAGVFPFLYALRLFTQVEAVFRIGATAAAVAVFFFWVVLLLCRCLRGRALLITGILCFLAIPAELLIDAFVSRMVGVASPDMWDLLAVLLLFVIAIAFVLGDCRMKKAAKRHDG